MKNKKKPKPVLSLKIFRDSYFDILKLIIILLLFLVLLSIAKR